MLSKEQILERNKLIRENGLKTRMKRAKQICKTKIIQKNNIRMI